MTGSTALFVRKNQLSRCPKDPVATFAFTPCHQRGMGRAAVKLFFREPVGKMNTESMNHF